MLEKFLDPKNDVAFRKIFGTEKNKDILIQFINDMIVFKEKKPIKSVTFLKPIQEPEVIAKKESIVDVLCSDEFGNTYIVEMQVAKEKGFEQRAQYYASKAYCNQLNVGGKYENLKEVIFLAIVDFVLFKEKKEYKSDHIILDKKTYENDLKDLSFTFLELPKIKKTLKESTSMVDKWAYFFNNARKISEEEAEILLDETNPLCRAYKELNKFSWSNQEYLAYEDFKKYEMDNIAKMDQKIDEGIEIGEVRGEKKANLKTAKKLLALKTDIETIISLTELSREEIEALKDEFFSTHFLLKNSP
jgi:predicted transposase/invertase (TIGR01784 family)